MSICSIESRIKIKSYNIIIPKVRLLKYTPKMIIQTASAGSYINAQCTTHGWEKREEEEARNLPEMQFTTFCSYCLCFFFFYLPTLYVSKRAPKCQQWGSPSCSTSFIKEAANKQTNHLIKRHKTAQMSLLP